MTSLSRSAPRPCWTASTPSYPRRLAVGLVVAATAAVSIACDDLGGGANAGSISPAFGGTGAGGFSGGGAGGEGGTAEAGAPPSEERGSAGTAGTVNMAGSGAVAGGATDPGQSGAGGTTAEEP